MIQLVFGIFIAGFVSVMGTLLAGLGLRGSDKWRSTITALFPLAGYLVMGCILWTLYSGLGDSGRIVLNAAGSPLATSLVIDRLGLYFSAIALVLAGAATVYSISYLAKYRNTSAFHGLTAVLISSVIGVAFSGDLLTLFIFWEAMSLSAYALVAFQRRSWEALEASVKYLFLAGVGSLTALYGISLIYSLTGTLNLAEVGVILTNANPSSFLALFLLLAGFGVEAAVAPLHMWLPDAHPAAPSPMSAILSGILIEVGSFTFIRVFNTAFNASAFLQVLQTLLPILAILTMLIGNLSALRQDDLKRLLAYSSIAQVGYILLAVSTFTVGGTSAGIFHIWNHALLKGLFFLLAGIATFAVGTRSLAQMSGLGRKAPALALLFTINALAMTGAPPFGLFWSEFMIVLSAIGAQSLPLSVGGILMLVNILISIGYYFKIIRVVAFSRPSGYMEGRTVRIPLGMMAPMIALLGLSLMTGLFPNFFYSPAFEAVTNFVHIAS